MGEAGKPAASELSREQLDGLIRRLRERKALRQAEEPPPAAGAAGAAGADDAEAAAGQARPAHLRSPAPAGRIPRRPADGPIPLSFAQERLWFLDELEPGGASYNIPAAVLLAGPLDSGDGGPLPRALAEIVRRHEALRTTFKREGGRPVAKVHAPGPLPLPLLDLSGLPRARGRAALRAVAAAEAAAPFDLAAGPLLRARLARLGPTQHALLLTFHHIVADGWSMGVLVAELGALYGAFREDRPSPLPELAIQYADFARWQRERLAGAALAGLVAWWRERLTGAPAVLELPTDRPRPALPSLRGGQARLALPPPLTRDLAGTGRRGGATLFMTLLAGWKTLLVRLAGRTDLVVGAPVANRLRPETEPLIGFLVNTLPLRTRLSDELPWLEALARVRETVAGAWAHQDLPFERLVEALAPQRSLSYAPLVQVLFTVQGAPPPLVLPGLAAAPLEVERAAAKLDLAVELEERDGGVAGWIEFNRDLFDAATVERWARCFVTLLAALAAEPWRRLAELPLLNAAEVRQLTAWSGGGPAHGQPLDLAEQIAARAAAAPAAVALEALAADATMGTVGRPWTYGELEAASNRLARHLVAAGIGPWRRVALALDRCPEFVLAALAVVKAGGAYVPFDPAQPAARLARLAQAGTADARPALLLTVERLAERLPELPGVPRLVLDGPERQAVEQHSPAPLAPRDRPAGADDLLYVIYTSGSTGQPKGAGVTRGAFAHLLGWYVGEFGFGPADRVLAQSAVSFDLTQKTLFAPLVAGGRLLLGPEPYDPQLLAAAVARCGVTRLNCTPSAFYPLLAGDCDRLASLRTVFLGGEPIAAARLAPWRRRPGTRAEVVNTYGPTECTDVVAFHRLPPAGAAEERPVPLGRPLPGLRLLVLDPALGLLPEGVPGQLAVGGGAVGAGYLDDPALTAARFVPDPFGNSTGARLYLTGDLARWRHLPGEGAGAPVLESLGRLDHQVKVRGYRVELGEVEAALAACPGVRETAAVVRGERLVAFAALAEELAAGAGQRLRELLRERLPEFMVPSAVILLPELPLTPNGKLDRQALTRLAGEAVAGRPQVPDEPAGEFEERLAALFGEVLGLPEGVGAGPGESFFDLGGHSLLATQLQSRIRDAFGLDLPLRRFFEAPTPAGLARLLREAAEDAGVDLRRGSIAHLPGLAGEGIPVPAGDEAGETAVSFAQERMWFLDRFDPGNPVYNISLAVRAVGALAPAALAAAFGLVVGRHEPLRSRFPEVGGRAVLALEAAPPLPPLPVIDLAGLAGLPAARRAAVADDLGRAELARPFDLAAGPLLRTTLVRLAAEEHLLLCTVHHIAADGWSVGLLLRELAAFYRAGTQGLPASPPPLSARYSDAVRWQRAQLAGGALAGQFDFWRERLAGLPVLRLPTDRPRAPRRRQRGGTRRVVLPAAVAAPLAGLARVEGATLFMALLTGLQEVLARWSGQRDFAVGSPVANRNRTWTEGLIGLFVNTLALRCDLEEGFAGHAAVARVREICLESYDHQDLPFERLVEELALEREPGFTPLVQVVLALQNAPLGPLTLPGLTLSPVFLPSPGARVDLTLSLDEQGAGLAGALEYDRDLFDPATAERLTGHLATLLGELAAHPGRRLAELPLLAPAERHQLLSEWSGAAARAPLEGTIPELFARQVACRPEAVALSGEGLALTYGELDRRAARLAGRLGRLGMGPEVAVAVSLERSPELIVALLAISRSGGAYLPLDTGQPRLRLASLLAQAGAALVLTTEDRRAALSAALPAGARALSLDEADPWSGGEPEASAAPALVVGPENLAYVLSTSGSTGEPKAVGVPHRAVVRLVRDTGYARFGPDEVFLQLAPVAFDASTLEIWGPLLNGGRLALAPPGPLAAAELDAVLARQGVTTLWLTSGLFHRAVEEVAESEEGGRGAGLRGLRQLLAGGDVLSPGHVRRALERLPGCELINGYGPTENTTFTCCHRLERSAAADAAVPIGRAIARTEVYVVDRAGRASPAGFAGELWAGGDGLARGYVGRPELTAERFVPHPFGGRGARLYRTGDLVRWRRDGRLEFLGRLDGQVKVRGFRIELGEVEAVLSGHPGVAAVAVVAEEAGPDDRRLVAYVVGREGSSPPHEELRELACRRLPGYMVPAAFVALPSLPLTVNGKLDRRALPRPDWAAGETPNAGAAPRTPLEELLVGLWAELLGVAGNRVGADSDFFALGGHSLLATRLVSRLREDLAVEVPLRSVFEAPTPRGLAQHIQAERRDRQVPPLRRLARTASLPLSFAQERLWFLEQLAPGGATYNVPTAVRLKGRLDPGALQAGLTEIARRHESLRTRFEVEQGAPVQRIAPAAALALPLVDLSAVAAAGAEARRLAAAESRRGFDLERGPVWRAGLLRLGRQEHLLLLTLHHIVADGWSLGVLVRELSALYASFAAGRSSPLAELGVQYGDFAGWQRQWLSGETLVGQMAYWRDRLAGLAALQLPSDRPPSPSRGWRGRSLDFHLSGELRVRLEELARRERSTLFMVLLGGLTALLARWAQQEDVAVGTAIANRPLAETEGLIGFFVNTLVLRTDLAGDPDGGELLRRMRETTLAAYAHQDLPFEKLVQELAPQRDLSRPPLVGVLLVLQNMALPELALPGLTCERVALAGETSRLDLTFSLVPQGEGLAGTLELASDLFDASTGWRLIGHFERLLAALAEPGGERARLSILPLLTPAEQSQLLWDWNDTPGEVETEAAGLHELVLARAAAAPEAVAVVCGTDRLTYRELAERALRLAGRLRGLGLGPEARVGVCLERGPQLVPALLGVLAAGGAYVPLDPSYPQERLELLALDAGIAVLVTEESLAARFAALGRSVPVVDAGAEAAPAVPALPVGWERVDPDQLAYLIYTSGSTGRPKGVAISHRNAVALVRWGFSRYTPAELAGVLAATSIGFDLSVFELFVPLGAGGTVVLAPDALALGELPEADRVTLINTVPSAMAELVRLGPAPSSLCTVNLAGEALARPLAEQVLRWRPGVRLLNLYGPSEDTTYSTWAQMSAGETGAPAIGRPVAGSAAYVLDGAGHPVPTGVPGQLCLAGAGLARGYLGRPELTAAKFLPDPFAARPGGRLYATGDLARWRRDGQLEFLGRLDHQVKVRGFRIELGEVEAVLSGHPGVAAVAVVAEEAGPDDRRLVAYVVGREGSSPPHEELRELACRRLPGYMVPAAFVALPSLPLTVNGKLDRRALPRPDWAAGETPNAGAAPRTPLEELLVGLWAELLGVAGNRVGADSDFFALGGHSLLATRLVSRLREDLAVEVPLRSVFEAPTPRGLAQHIQAERRDRQVPPLRRLARTASLPLSFAQERLWFLEQLAPGGATYNVPTAVRLKGRLDPGALQAGLTEIARRHESLRTRFEVEQGAPVQRVAPAAALALPLVDLSAVAAAGAEARRLAAAESRRGFDLERGPVWRAGLLRLGRQEHLLLLTLHHIVADGWSLGVLVRELSALYASFAAGRSSPLAELGVQYGDFAGWQRQWLSGETLAGQMAYWRDRLAGLAALQLPSDRPPSPSRGWRGRSLDFYLSGEVRVRLEELARRERSTLFMVLLGGLTALLARWAQQEDVAVGTAIANRPLAETEGLIGFFVNTLVLRTDLAGDPDGGELLRRMRETTLAAYAHQDLPFEKLVQELAPQRDLSRPPLVGVLLVLQNMALPELALPGLTCERVALAGETSRLDLTFSLVPQGEGLAGTLELASDLFDASRGWRLIGHFERLLAALAEPGGERARLSILPLLTPAEQSQLLWDWNDTPGEVETEAAGLHELVLARAAAAPEAVAVVCGTDRLTYRELAERALRLAGRLRGLGLGPEARVGVCLERGPQLVPALLGVLAAGGAYVPLDPSYPQERLELLALDAGIAVLVTEESLAARFAALGRSVPVVDAGAEAAPAVPALPVGWERVDPDQLAYLIYTSGSTGRPKGVAISHRNAVALVRWGFSRYTPAELAGVLAATSIGFDLSVFELFVPLGAGGTVVLAPDALALGELPEADRVTLINTVPSAMAELVRLGPAPSSLCTVNLAGEALARPLAEQVLRWRPGVRLLNLYGPSEDTTYSTWAQMSAGERGAPAIGRPVAGSAAYVLDGAGHPVPTGVPGQLCLAGAGLARGYLGRPELTAAKFLPDPFAARPGGRLYATGDLARWRGDGQLEFLGRLDHQVKVRGFRIEPGEIEAVLAAHPAVREAVVSARDEGGLHLVAYLTLDRPAGSFEHALQAELRADLQARLPAHMVPGAFVVLDAFPLLANGKLDRRALPAPPKPASRAGAGAPAGPLAEVIAGIMAAALELDGIGVGDDFFDLGGHSLLATRVVSRLRAVLAVELPVRQLFETPTAAGLATVLGRRQLAATGAEPPPEAPPEPPIVRVPRTQSLPLSFSQERLWFLDRLQPGSAAYNMPVGLRLRGALAPALLAASLQEIVRRHEILRTTFGASGGQPFQRIAPWLEIALPVVDLGGLPGPARDSELERQIAAEKATPFDLERGPLLRARILRQAADDWVLLLDLHHIVCDGWSLRRLFHELTLLYGAGAAGKPSPLPELEVQYADYAHWQRRWLQGAVLERHLEYWRGQLGGILPVLDLPTDRLRPPIQTFRGGSRTALLPAALGEDLRALGRGEGVTLFMTLFAAFNLLLHRLSGQEDLVVGIPIAGRNRVQIEDLLGFFVNSLVLRTDLGGQPAFRGLLARVRQVALDAYAYQDLAFERLLQELRLERDLSRTPLFQVYFNFQSYAGALPAMPGLAAESLAGEEELSKFDLTLYVLDQSDGRVRLDLVYNADLFSAERCGEMLAQYQGLLAQAAARPDAAVDRFSLLTPASLQQLPDPARELDGSWRGPVHGYLTAWAARDPERPAVIDPAGTWSYRELESQSNRLAHLLLADGIGKQEAVAIYAHRSATLVWAVLGVLKAGAAFVVLDPAYPPARTSEILRLARPRFWLAMQAAGAVPGPLARFVADLPGCRSLELPPWQVGATGSAFAGLPDDDPGLPAGPEDLACIAFTSGSTGAPKGILGRHGPLSHFLPWQREKFGLTGEDRFSLLSGLAHDPLQRDLFTPLFLGARICIPEPAEIVVAGQLSAWMGHQGVTVAHLTPAMGQVLTEDGPRAAECLPALRYVFLVGDILTRRDVARLQRLAPGVTCVNLYGSTETQRAVGFSVTAAAGSGEQRDKEILPLGRGMEDVQLLVLNRAGERAGIGELGEIAVRSPHLARGYLADEAATARKFLVSPFTGQPGDRLYLTGDLGRYLPDGAVAFAGRADSQVKIRGYRIELGEIEAQLGRVAGVREAVALATEAAGADGRLVAFVVPEPEAALSAAGLRDHLRTVLPAYMVPGALVFLTEIPLTPNRKVDRRALLQLASAQRESGADFRAPRTRAELLIAGALCEALGVERVGAEDNFFDLGGNSLLLLQVQSRLQALFQREVPVLELFSNPTVSALARFLTPTEREAPAAAGDHGAAQVEAGKQRRLRRFQTNQKAAERRRGES